MLLFVFAFLTDLAFAIVLVGLFALVAHLATVEFALVALFALIAHLATVEVSVGSFAASPVADFAEASVGLVVVD